MPASPSHSPRPTSFQPLATPPPTAHRVSEGELTAAVRAFIVDVHSSGSAEEPIKPVRLLQAVSARHAQYGHRAEQDSHEVLRQLLEGLRAEEVSRLRGEVQVAKQAEAARSGKTPWAKVASVESQERAKPTPDPATVVDDIFSGELRSTVVCCTCGHVSCSHEPFLDLSLPLPLQGQFPLTGAAAQQGGDAGPAGAGGSADGSHAGNGASEGGGFCSAEELKVGLTAEALAKLPSQLTSVHSQLRLSACLQAFCAPETLRGEDAYE